MRIFKKLIAIVAFLFISKDAYANIMVPSVMHQFMSFHWLGLFSIFVGVTIITIESFFVRKLLSIKRFRAFRISFFINAASTLLGPILIYFFYSALSFYGLPFNYDFYSKEEVTWQAFIPGYVLTIIVEGLILLQYVWIIKREIQIKEVFKTALIMNFFSYLILMIVFAISPFVIKYL